jgi:hypothetical protein
MALNIKDTETEKLAAEVAEMTGDTKTGAVRKALREKRERLEMEELLDPEWTGDFSKTDLPVIDLSDLRRDDTGWEIART